MRTPSWDSGFPNSGMHGVEAQNELIRLATRHSRRMRTAIDVGAHIGTTALALADRFTTVHAFEPVEENFNCLVDNTSSYKHVVNYNVALRAEEGERYALRMPEKGNSGCWYVETGGRNQARTLDSFDFDSVDFIKLDVEGSEGLVLVGAVELLKRCLPAVLFEDNDIGSKYYGSEWVDPKHVLSLFSYKPVTRIHKNEVWAWSR